MVRDPNSPPASFRMKETQMLLSSNCTAILHFSLRDLWEQTSVIVVQLSKWESNEEIKRIQAEYQEEYQTEGPKDIAEASWLAVKLSSPPLLCMTSLIQSCLGMHSVCARFI